MLKVSSPKDFWIGVIYLAIGSAGLWFGWVYPIGSAGRMGSGYFPKVLSVAIILFGVASLVRSVAIKGTPISRLQWQPLILIPLACALFGLLLEPAGLIVALTALVLTSAVASRNFALDVRSIGGMLALIAACVLVFVKGLGMPMPLLGSALDPIVGPYLPWLR